MKLRIDGYTLYLGKLRTDGFHNVERVRPTNLRSLLPSLRKARIRSRMVGKRLVVQTTDPDQCRRLGQDPASTRVLGLVCVAFVVAPAARTPTETQ